MRGSVRPAAKRRLLVRAAFAAPLLCAIAANRAQSRHWPEKPIKLVLGYPTGGAADGIARPLQPKAEAQLGQPLIFEYRPGAGATLAADYVARAPADGYTVHLLDSGVLTIAPNARRLSYDPLTSFTPITMAVTGGVALVAHPSFSADNVPQLIALLKAKPGVYAYGTSGIGGPGHLAAELFKAMSGTEIVHVPYKGGAPAMIDLVGGQVPLLFASMGTAVPYIQSGKIKALGVTSTTRAGALPNVPTVAEQGVTGYDATTWFAFVGPAKLPPEVLLRLNAALTNALADAGVQLTLRRQGYEPAPGSSEQLHDRIKADLAKWGKVIHDHKLVFE